MFEGCVRVTSITHQFHRLHCPKLSNEDALTEQAHKALPGPWHDIRFTVEEAIHPRRTCKSCRINRTIGKWQVYSNEFTFSQTLPMKVSIGHRAMLPANSMIQIQLWHHKRRPTLLVLCVVEISLWMPLPVSKTSCW